MYTSPAAAEVLGSGRRQSGRAHAPPGSRPLQLPRFPAGEELWCEGAGRKYYLVLLLTYTIGFHATTRVSCGFGYFSLQMIV